MHTVNSGLELSVPGRLNDMDPVEPSTPAHPLGEALRRLDEELDHAAVLPVWSLDTATAAASIEQLTALSSRVAALRLSVLAHGDVVDVAGPSGASSAATWLAHAVQATRPEAFRDTRLARSLAEPRHTCVQTALAAGLLLPEQARVIVTAVDALPVEGEFVVDAATLARAEAFLVDQARSCDAARLRILGDRLLEVIAPDLADAYEAKRLADEEKRAAQTTRLTMSPDGHGSVFVRAKLPELYAAMLKKILLAYAAPKHQAATAAAAGQPTPARKPSPERMGQAFCDLLESLTDTHAPQTGGTGATVVVTMDWATLTGGLKAAHLDTGELISPGAARRLACQAGLIPAVLGTGSVPLDLGRRTRFHTKAQRIAIALRDGGCTDQGCDWPPGMCHVHHDPPWSQGGVTDLEHARMLCPHHHARAHDPAYDATRHPNGKVSFHRRT